MLRGRRQPLLDRLGLAHVSGAPGRRRKTHEAKELLRVAYLDLEEHLAQEREKAEALGGDRRR